ncbi:MAG TPA: ATP-binding cassette domain-containing protein [Candidatus Dormibacteraeota bacterium]
MTARPVAIRCQGLVKVFGSVRALDGVGFEVGEGELFGLLGPNGAGKTTTIRVLVTLLPPDAGSAAVFGLDVRRQVMAVRRQLGYVPQQLSADASLTGYENVSLFARLFDVPRPERHARVMESLAAMGLQDAAFRLAGTYSGGMIRRLELAQSLVNQPRLLVLDEPTIGLDPVARGDVWDGLRALRNSLGTTVLITTHYMEEADQLCDRVALMHRGRLQAIGAPADLKAGLGKHATLEDVFRHYTGDRIDERGDFKDVRAVRRAARRLG